MKSAGNFRPLLSIQSICSKDSCRLVNLVLDLIDLRESGSSWADFTNGLKPRLRLKCKTLVLNFVNRMIRPCS